MADALAGLVDQPLRDHLVIGVERAVEEQQRRALEPRPQRIVELGAARDEEEMTAGRGLGHLQADRVAFLRAEAGAGSGVLEIKRDLARHREGLDGDAGRTSRTLDREGTPERHGHSPDECGSSTSKMLLAASTPSTRSLP